MCTVKKLKHILDYPTLKSWGFIPAGVLSSDNPTVVSYYSKGDKIGDMFNFNGLYLTIIPALTVQWKWHLVVLDNDKDNPHGTVLFTGKIHNKEELKNILNCTLLFKPKKNDRHK